MQSTRITQRTAQRLCRQNLPNITRNSRGTPLLSSRFVPQHRTATTRTTATYTTPSQRFKDNLRKAQKDYPILLPVLFVATLASVSLLGLLTYDEYTRVSPQYAAYPTGVEQQLRVALHYTHVQPDPDAAAHHFTGAIKQADRAGMNPFSKEVIGIRVRFSEMLEKFGRMKGAVEILEGIVKDCENKLEEVDLAGGEGEEHQIARTALLRSIIQLRVKASSLYETEYLQNPAQAKQTLSDAVGLLVKETQDSQTKGFSEDNAAGISLEEIASILSQMGDLYATTGEEANAVQVYMLTLEPLRKSCNGTRTCKEVQVLSNIASTMTVAMKRPGASINGKPATRQSLEAARRATLKWAEQAIGAAEKVNPAERDQMCELGLISAEMTKADLLLEGGAKDKQQARELFRSLIPRLKEKQLDSLVTVVEQNLQKAGG